MNMTISRTTVIACVNQSSKTCKSKKIWYRVEHEYEKFVGRLKWNKCIVNILILTIYMNCVTKEGNYMMNNQIEMYLESQEELRCRQKTKMLTNVCQPFELNCSIIQKWFCNYHGEVKWIKDGDNLVVNIYFNKKNLLFYYKIIERSINKYSF